MIYFDSPPAAPQRLIILSCLTEKASHDMKDNFLYSAPAAARDPRSYIKRSSIGNVPAETITTGRLCCRCRLLCTERRRKERLSAKANRYHSRLEQRLRLIHYVQLWTSDVDFLLAWMLCFLCPRPLSESLPLSLSGVRRCQDVNICPRRLARNRRTEVNRQSLLLARIG